MKSQVKFPTREYPYIAVYTGDGKPLSQEEILEINKDEIVLISMCIDMEKDKKPYVQYLIGGRTGYFTDEENLYSPLPKGTEINIIQ